jgi:hypothetical protein
LAHLDNRTLLFEGQQNKHLALDATSDDNKEDNNSQLITTTGGRQTVF